jgi:hypothetical protein
MLQVSALNDHHQALINREILDCVSQWMHFYVLSCTSFYVDFKIFKYIETLSKLIKFILNNCYFRKSYPILWGFYGWDGVGRMVRIPYT